ncbi:integral membrane sensor signal transduction histidine kinase [Leptolyngbya sp. NIES-3755]|nr:integral membrane sensor signal transduction histidine kinase [Leptolyngbya sp. NIES-3755]
MRLRSFRLRIASFSAALAGIALMGFGAISWVQIYNAKLNRLDADLLNQLMRSSRLRDRENRSRSPNFPPDAFGRNTSAVVLVLDSQSNLLYQSDPSDSELNRVLRQSVQFAPAPLKRELSPISSDRPPPPRPQFQTEQVNSGTWRIAAANFPDNRVAIAVNLQAIDQEMASIRNIFLISIPGMLLLVAGGAWIVAGRALQPVRQLTGAIQRVTVTGLDQRIPVGTTDVEFVQLIQVFNQMLERLERSFTQASRFSADAAHELKTPLTILQGELERSLQQVEPGSEVQQRLSSLLDEVHRLSSIMRKLLLLSLADAGQMSLYRVEVDVSKLLIEMLEDIELLAPHLSVEADIRNSLRVQGDRDLLYQVLQNLFSNAIKYNLAEGWIKIDARSINSAVQVRIANASKEIPVEDRDRIFDRFHRGDPARTRKVEGLGLGLSLAREIVRAHQGDLKLEATRSGETAFILTLPTVKF